ncbi:MAG: glycosyltransferase family 9 protein [Thermodesulfobacteriota bacterium]
MFYAVLAYLSYPLVYILSRFSSGKMDSVLVFQTAKIGDMIATSPVFREIKKRLPAARLGVVAEPVCAPLLEYNPHIDEVIVFDGKLARGLLKKISFAMTLKRMKWSAAVILMPNSANMLAAFWAGIPLRVAVRPDFIGTTQRLLMGINTHNVAHRGRRSVETYLKCLEHLGVRAGDIEKEVYSAPGVEFDDYVKGKGPFIGIAAGTANKLKDWGAQRFAILTEMIMDKTPATLIFFGSGEDRRGAEKIIAAVDMKERAENLCGSLRLSELPAIIKNLSLVIGVDTGLVYMADALGVPVIDIAGPSDMEDQRPTGPGSFIIQKKGLDCVPCSHTFKTPYKCRYGHRRCVEDITPEEVFNVLLRIIPAFADSRSGLSS